MKLCLANRVGSFMSNLAWADAMKKSKRQNKTIFGDLQMPTLHFHCEDCEHRWKLVNAETKKAICPRCGEICISYHAEHVK